MEFLALGVAIGVYFGTLKLGAYVGNKLLDKESEE